MPEPGPGQVRIRTWYSLMSIGTETIVLGRKYDPDTHFARMFSPQNCSEAYALANERRHDTMGILYDWTESDW